MGVFPFTGWKCISLCVAAFPNDVVADPSKLKSAHHKHSTAQHISHHITGSAFSVYDHRECICIKAGHNLTALCWFTQEVQPGLYSVHLPPSPNPGLIRIQVQQHHWQDPLLCSIRDFLRPERCITPPQPPSASPALVRETPCTSATAVAGFADSTPDANVTAAAEVAPFPAAPVAWACQQTASDTQGMHSLQAPSQLSFDSAVDLMLTALARSVAVRCQCIDQHSPHKQPVRCSADATSQSSVLPSQAGTGKAGEAATCIHSSTVETNHGLDTILHQAHTNGHDRQMDDSYRQHGNQDIAPLRQPGLATASVQQSLTVQTEGHHLHQDLGTQAMAASVPTPVLQPHTQCPSPSAVNQKQPSHTTVQPPNQRQAGELQAAPVLILFSGGVDSTLIAALAHRALPPGVPIDLASVCFTGGTSGDRQAALDALQELADFAPAREWRLIRVDSSLEEVDAHKDWLLGVSLWRCCLCCSHVMVPMLKRVWIPVAVGSASASFAIQPQAKCRSVATWILCECAAIICHLMSCKHSHLQPWREPFQVGCRLAVSFCNCHGPQHWGCTVDGSQSRRPSHSGISYHSKQAGTKQT